MGLCLYDLIELVLKAHVMVDKEAGKKERRESCNEKKSIERKRFGGGDWIGRRVG